MIRLLLSAFLLLPLWVAAQDHLLISEIVVTPTDGEFIEIYNPTQGTIDLSDYYITDATFASGGAYYYNIVTGSNAGGGSFGDFHARFPDGATIAPGEYQTLAMNGTGFTTEYAITPTYELWDTDGAIPDMREALPGLINGQGGLTNSGEVVILYTWDGSSDLVQDVDYLVWGDKAEAVDKTGVTIGQSTYLPDTPIDQQISASPGQPHNAGESIQRQSSQETGETQSGGNGLTGHDETSEDLATSFPVGTPTPGSGPGGGGEPIISNITQTPPTPTATDTVSITADVTDNGTVVAVRLFTSINSAPFDSTNMNLTTGNTYQAEILPQPEGTTVDYFIKAVDDENLVSTSATFSYTVSGGAVITPIRDIQENFPTYQGQVVTIQGIVTLGAGRTTTAWTTAYVQDSSGRGINIFRSGTVDPLLVRGNEVQITGTVDEFSGITEIVDYSAQVISSGNPIPDPMMLTTSQATNNIDLEGTYVSIEGTIIDIFTAGTGTNVVVDDGSGEATARVWDETGINLSGFTVGDSVNIRAVLGIFQSLGQLVPGYQDELVKIGTTPGDGSGSATITPDSVGLNEMVTETITLTGQAPFVLESVRITVPQGWQWTGEAQASGDGFTGATVTVQDSTILITSANVTATEQGIIEIQSLTSPAQSTLSVFIVETAVSGGTLTRIATSPSVLVSEGGPLITPIKEIQENFPIYNGQIVTIQGIVTLGSGITITTRTDAYVQDNSGRGINIFSFDPPDPDLVRGNEVQITGEVTEFGGVTEITNFTVQVISTGNPIPAPLELTTQQANNIDLEGTYIQITGNITSMDVFPDATNLTVDDGSGDVLLRVWASTGIDLSGFAVNDLVMISAVMDLFNNQAQLIPGYQDEIVKVNVLPGDGSGIATISPDSVATSQQVTETLTITGEAPFVLETIQVIIPPDWLWDGTVQIGGDGFTGAIVEVQGTSIIITSSIVSSTAPGTVTVSGLTSPATNALSTFTVKTAVAGGLPSPIANQPEVVVGSGSNIVKIADIQDNLNIYLGQVVTIEGFVTLGSGRTITTRTDAYIQDNSGRGINIFSFDPPDPLLERGNLVRITGTVDDFNGVTEITDYTIQLLSTGNSLPDPLLLSTSAANDISLEGTYIRVIGVANQIDAFPDATNITVNDGSGDVTVRVWASTGINLGFLSQGDSVQVTAVMDIFNGQSQLTPGYQDEVARPGETSQADGSGVAFTSLASVAVNDTLPEFSVVLLGTVQDTIRKVRVDVPVFWSWSALDQDLQLSGSAFTNAFAKIELLEGIFRITIDNAAVTLSDSGIVTFKKLLTAPDSVNSVFWVKTAGANGNLSFIASSPVVTVGGGNLYWMYDLQTHSSNFPNPVTVRGVTTIGAGLLRQVSSGGTPLTTAYIQDASGRGINLFAFGVLDTAIISRNNLVEATGPVTEFGGVTELEYDQLKLLGTGFPLPEPVLLKNKEVNSLKWDGTYIQTDGVVLEKFSAGGGTTIQISDGEGSTNVRVWDTANLDLSGIEVNKKLIVTGVGGVFIPSSGDTVFQILSVYGDQLEIDESYQASLANSFLEVEPYPFVPDRGEKIAITYNAGAVNNQVTIRIFDLGGRLVQTLFSNTATLIQNTIEWDGRDELSDLVPLGTYICHLQVVEPVSGKTKSDTAPIVVGTILNR